MNLSYVLKSTILIEEKTDISIRILYTHPFYQICLVLSMGKKKLKLENDVRREQDTFNISTSATSSGRIRNLQSTSTIAIPTKKSDGGAYFSLLRASEHHFWTGQYIFAFHIYVSTRNLAITMWRVGARRDRLVTV